MGLFSKLFGGNKSEKDVKTILPLVSKINQHFSAYQSLSNDELRNKTTGFRERIAEALKGINAQIADANKQAEALSFTDLMGKDAIYQQVDKLKKERDQ